MNAQPANQPSSKTPFAQRQAEQAHERVLKGGDVGGGAVAAVEEKKSDPAQEFIRQQRAVLVPASGRALPTKPLAMWEMELQNYPEPEWLARNLVEEKSVVLIGGEPKAAKSFSGLELMLSIASGTRVFNRFDVGPPRTVAVLCAEDSPVHVRRRIKSLAAGKNLDTEERKHAWNNLFVFERQRLNLMDNTVLDEFMCHLRRLPEPPAAVMLDPMVNLFQVEDENDARGMTAVMDQLRIIRDVMQCAVLLIHHSAKSGAGKSKARGGQKMRGSSVIHGAVDGGIYLSNTETGPGFKASDVEVETRNGQPGGDFRMTLNLEDDAAGRVLRAWWSHDEGDKAEQKKPSDKQAEDRVLQILRMQALTLTDLVREAGGRRAAIYAAVKKLEVDGLIVRGFQNRLRAVESTQTDLPGKQS